MTTLDPSLAHNAHLSKILDGLDGKKVSVPANMRLTDDPGATPEQTVSPEVLAPPPSAEPVPVETPAIEEPVAEEAPAVAQEVTPAPPPETKPQPRPAQTALAKRAEIQRRAREASERARTAADRLRARPQASPPPDPVAKERQVVEQEKQRVAQLQARLDNEIRLAQTDPLGFARRHNVGPEKIAAYVRDGADPNKLALEHLRAETAQAIHQVRQEYQNQLQAIQQQFIASEDARAQQNFFTFVEEAKDANPEAFAALHSGLVFSDKDVWDTANRLLEQNADLRDNFDEDRLLEAVEAEARKDPRWSRVQSLLKSTNSPNQQPNAPPKSKSNVRAKEEVSEPQPQAEAAPPKAAQSRSPDGKFVPVKSRSPFEEHQIHLANVMRRAGIFR